MGSVKPNDGIWINTISETRVEIEGRVNRQSLIRAMVVRGHPVIAEVVTIEALDLNRMKQLHEVLAGVIKAVEVAQREMVNES